MSEFNHISDDWVMKIREAIAPLRVELINAEYVGQYSAYRFTFSRDGIEHTEQVAYDFRIEALGETLSAVFPPARKGKRK